MTAATIDPKERMLQIRRRVKEIDHAIEDAQDKDWKEYAGGVMDKFFDASPKVKKFLDNCVSQATKYSHVMAPSGRVRNLWRTITGRPQVIAAAARRAQNSPIQGFSSEMGCVAAYNILKSSYFYLKEFGDLADFPKYCRAVHDANYYCVPYAMLLPFVHIFQYDMTQGVADWYEEHFNLKFTIEPEIEMDIGAHDAASETWSWDITQLADVIFLSLKIQIEIGTLKDDKLEEAIATIIQPWKNKASRDHLFKKFPLQNVRDLDYNQYVKAFLSRMNSRLAEHRKAA